MEGLAEFVARKLNEGFSQEVIADGLALTGVDRTEAVAFVAEVAEATEAAGWNHGHRGWHLGSCHRRRGGIRNLTPVRPRRNFRRHGGPVHSSGLLLSESKVLKGKSEISSAGAGKTGHRR